jgi:hypothetical protein
MFLSKSSLQSYQARACCASVEAQNAAFRDAEAHIELRCPDMIPACPDMA